MTIQDLGSLGELVAAIATVATLIYLAIQIRMNTRATKEAATRSLLLANSEATMAMVSDGDLADILLRGIYDSGELKSPERLRFNGYLFSYYNQVDYAYEIFRAGDLDERTWNKISKEIPAYIGSPGGRKWWSQDRVRFSPEFASYVDNVLDESEPPEMIPSVPPGQ
ncbi:MAG: hypothetical protein ACU84Q_09215 [Gammaproteobacteria bacterium]